MYNIFLYWQNLDNTVEPPPYISLCIESIYKYCKKEEGFKINLLNNNNLKIYLPNIREDIFKIEYDWKNESFFGRKAKSVSEESMNKRKLAIISDYIRIALLEKYGGLWTDADHIFLRSPIEIFKHLENKDFVASERGWKTFTISNGFIGSIKNGLIISKWKLMLDEILDKMKENNNYIINRYGFFGEISIGNIIKKNIDKCYIYKDETILPISCKNKKIFIKNKNEINLYKELFSKNPIICGIWNAGLNEKIKLMSKKELLNSNLVISEIYRKSLNINNNNKFINLIKEK